MPLTSKFIINLQGIYLNLKSLLMNAGGKRPGKSPSGRVFKIQKKSRTIFDQINAITH